MNPYEAKPAAFPNPPVGLSERALQIHHDKLYVGYVNKMNEVREKLRAARTDAKVLDGANQTYSDLRALRDGETFATNGVYLHEYFFACLGGDGNATGPLVDAIKEKYGSLQDFIRFFSATGMAVRGWVVLAFDTHLGRLKIYGADSHNQGGIWGAIPLIVLDVYEHSYFIDYGSDRKKYIEDFWKSFHWANANALYNQCLKMLP